MVRRYVENAKKKGVLLKMNIFSIEKIKKGVENIYAGREAIVGERIKNTEFYIYLTLKDEKFGIRVFEKFYDRFLSDYDEVVVIDALLKKETVDTTTNKIANLIDAYFSTSNYWVNCKVAKESEK